LSAMQHDVFSFGADVAQTLFDVMRGKSPASHTVQVPGLVPRASTAAPRQA
jgi:DNA-binding LacI/PurR family transcriptional regulator